MLDVDLLPPKPLRAPPYFERPHQPRSTSSTSLPPRRSKPAEPAQPPPPPPRRSCLQPTQLEQPPPPPTSSCIARVSRHPPPPLRPVLEFVVEDWLQNRGQWEIDLDTLRIVQKRIDDDFTYVQVRWEACRNVLPIGRLWQHITITEGRLATGQPPNPVEIANLRYSRRQFLMRVFQDSNALNRAPKHLGHRLIVFIADENLVKEWWAIQYRTAASTFVVHPRPTREPHLSCDWFASA